MTQLARRRFALVAALAVSSTLGACIVVPAGRHYGPDGGHGGPVTVAPPELQVEAIGIAPGPGYFWIGGFWNWIGGRHVWIGGHWQAPRPGHYWLPHRWHRDGPRWRAEPGHWRAH
jgi:hypothetical protein